ncbi:Lhr family helicase [Microlunatus speluncae]|uniref:Lhr family helicase n=1 Tax=Microlunatus speluncae TaxID=2594267 RepID=UPI001FE7D065|nr:DEAD/DEAH box helicase [Microlunatus speluncae]
MASRRVDPLAAFAPATAAWFRDVFAEPTAAQAGAWSAISSGENALVIAPTGSGKTLAAFLWALDGLIREPEPPAKERCRVLYVSPLKALAVDVERNLRAPLAGIGRAAGRLGEPMPGVTVGIRSGDTSAADRRKLATRPPDIMITTPESLFLMLTSAARDTLASVRTVIIDEVHSLAGTKRGAHLAVSLERLQELISSPPEPTPSTSPEPTPSTSPEPTPSTSPEPTPSTSPEPTPSTSPEPTPPTSPEPVEGQARPAARLQRIGLSATVRPPERVARYLGGTDPVTIVAPPAQKSWQLELVVPIEDMSDLQAAAAPRQPDPVEDLEPEENRRPPSIWPHVESKILDLIGRHRTTLVFANSRRLAERLTAHLNELHAERLGEAAEPHEPPAEIMAQSGSSAGRDGSAAPIVARAHHGSVSKEQRAQIEDDLKSGRLPCVVATSSLELGIDMGTVDLVVQVESPPSVASGLQRVGRAGHQVGAVSRGVFFPNHRGDLIESTVVVERMRAGAIEAVAELRNPLDVLAQQIVAIAAGGDVAADDVYQLMRRAANFADLPRSAFDAVLDMLSGRYPSEDFAELRPRLVWQRDTGQLSARPGAQRLAVTSGGTIPDRGLFGVFLAGESSTPGRRVGELDEEMVYETRVGDVFTLGTTSWRVEQITHDQVLVTPAPGQPGRLPFWKGDAPARPAELGVAFGGFVRELAGLDPEQATGRLQGAGLDDYAARNLIGYLGEQQQATGALPTDRTVIFERFRDELGDWRVCLHSPLGLGVHTPWALAIEHAARERYGTEVQATATNDGIILRIPDTESDPPGPELIIIDPEALEQIVTDEVGGSALFASRFRECAARALLLPRRDPRARSPLWQQRMRSAQLLGVAAKYPDFPIVLETMRECLTDVFELPELIKVQQSIAGRELRVVEVETSEPSPFARSLLFGYVGAFVYEGDVPLAEKKAAALSLDATLLAELLGKDGLKQLLDPGVIAACEADLQALSEERQAGTVEQVYDLIRTAGPYRLDELALRTRPDPERPEFDHESAVKELITARRLVEVRIAGTDQVAVVEDVPRLRDGLGIPVPPGVAASFTEPVPRPIDDLVLRWARQHGPFVAETIADRYGLELGTVEDACRRLIDDGSVVAGQFIQLEEDRSQLRQYCHHRVLALIKRRTLALLRREVEPVEQGAYARFLIDWHGVGTPARGSDAVLTALESLAGYPVPASAVESIILPARVADYQPSQLDQLITAGEVSWVGDGQLGDSDGWVRFLLPGMEPPPAKQQPEDHRAVALLSTFQPGGASFLTELTRRLGDDDEASGYESALWELIWSGLITGDTFAPVRARVTGGAHRSRPAPRSRTHRGQLRAQLRARVVARINASPTTAGRWSLIERGESAAADQAPDPGRTRGASARFTDQVFGWLDRYGVVTRGSVTAEGTEGGFGAAYRALATLEESGQCRRGYFIEGLGAAQFALPGAVDRLRAASAEPTEPAALVLSACDPANPYGAALGWPERAGHRPGRKAGALVVLVGGQLIFYVERGGRTLLSFVDRPEVLAPAARALAAAVRHGQLGKLTVQRADGDHVFGSEPVRKALQDAGFVMTPQGLRIRPAAGSAS